MHIDIITYMYICIYTYRERNKGYSTLLSSLLFNNTLLQDEIIEFFSDRSTS